MPSGQRRSGTSSTRSKDNMRMPQKTTTRTSGLKRQSGPKTGGNVRGRVRSVSQPTRNKEGNFDLGKSIGQVTKTINEGLNSVIPGRGSTTPGDATRSGPSSRQYLKDKLGL